MIKLYGQPASMWLLALSVVVLPWYVLRFDLAGLPLTITEVVVGLTIGVWFIELLWQRRRPSLPDRSWLLAMALIMIAATISLVISPHFRAALGIYKAYLIEPMLLFLVIVDTLRQNQRRWTWLLAGLSIAALQVAVLCWSQYVIGWPIWSVAEQSQGRSTAMFNTGNAVGLFLAPILLLVLSLSIWLAQQRRWWSAIILWVTVGLCMSAIFMSQSAGAIIGLGVGLVSLGVLAMLRWRGWSLMLQRWSKLLAIVVIVGYAGVILGYITWFNHPPTVANPYTRPGFSTLTVRQCTWEGTIAGLKQSPIIGFGLAGFSTTYLKTATCDAEPLVYPHNFILNAWVELGVLGLISLLLVSWLWLGTGLSLVGQSSWPGWLAIGLVGALVYLLIHGLVDVPYFKNDLSLLWWILAAMTASLRFVMVTSEPE